MLKNKTFWIGFVAVYVVAQIVGYVVHEILLSDTYQALASVWRPEQEMMSMMWVMFITSAISLFVFCWIFTRGYEGRGIMEGVRYGVLIGLLMSVPMAFESYVIYPVTLELAVSWCVAGFAYWIIAGAVFAAIYRPGARGAM